MQTILDSLSNIQNNFNFDYFLQIDWLYIILVLVAVVVSKYIVHFIIKEIVHVLSDQNPATTTIIERRIKTVGSLLSNIASVLIYTTGTLVVLSTLGLNILPILAGAGILGLAIAFGSQTLVRDFVTGFIILSENHMNVGDYVEVEGITGRVKSLEIRVTTIEDMDGNLVIIPNSNISKIKLLKDIPKKKEK